MHVAWVDVHQPSLFRAPRAVWARCSCSWSGPLHVAMDLREAAAARDVAQLEARAHEDALVEVSDGAR